MFADSRESIGTRMLRAVSGQKILLPISFPSRGLLVLKSLLNGTKFNQDYFIDAIFPGLHDEKRRISRKDGFPACSAHTANSMCHNGNKISKKLAKGSIGELQTHFTLQK
jgi:hypothetical protein